MSSISRPSGFGICCCRRECQVYVFPGILERACTETASLCAFYDSDTERYYREKVTTVTTYELCDGDTESTEVILTKTESYENDFGTDLEPCNLEVIYNDEELWDLYQAGGGIIDGTDCYLGGPSDPGTSSEVTYTNEIGDQDDMEELISAAASNSARSCANAFGGTINPLAGAYETTPASVVISGTTATARAVRWAINFPDITCPGEGPPDYPVDWEQYEIDNETGNETIRSSGTVMLTPGGPQSAPQTLSNPETDSVRRVRLKIARTQTPEGEDPASALTGICVDPCELSVGGPGGGHHHHGGGHGF